MTRFLQLEREVLERYAPGLDAALARLGFEAAEQRGSQAIGVFRQHAAGRLVIPPELGGRGASALEVLRFQIALGSRAPSLAVATTMHHYKLAALCRLRPARELDAVLAQVAERDWLVASGGSEGEPGRKLYQPAVRAEDTPDGIVVEGTKKPCCLTWSMDLLSVMVRSAPESRYRGELLHVLIDPRHPAVHREPFWTSPLLAGAESDAVRIARAPVPEGRVFRVGSAEAAEPFALAAFSWFELLACGAYLGVASGLFERVLQAERGGNPMRAEVACELDALAAALESTAARLDAGELSEALLSRIFRVRYAVERRLPEVAGRCFDALGGLGVSRIPEAGYLVASVRLLACHTPSLSTMTDNLAGQLLGEPLVLA